MKRLSSKKMLKDFATALGAETVQEPKRFEMCKRVLYTYNRERGIVTGIICQDERGRFIYAEGLFKPITLFTGSPLVPIDPD